MKRRSFEEALPEGYVSRLTVDCQDKKLGILMNLAALAIMAVLCVVFWRLIQPWDAFLAAPSVPAGVQQHQYHTYHGADDGKTESESLHKTKAHHAVPPSSLGSRFPAAASRSATTARE